MFGFSTVTLVCLCVTLHSADPLSMSPQKALETIGANLQKQYENWQPRVSARAKQPSDTLLTPTQASTQTRRTAGVASFKRPTGVSWRTSLMFATSLTSPSLGLPFDAFAEEVFMFPSQRLS